MRRGCISPAVRKWVSHSASSRRLPAQKVTVVDTTGAGDSLAGTILWGLHAGHDLQTAAKMAVMVAAEVISEIGARPSRELQPLLAEMQ